jgi:hypothetical protein
LQTSRTVLAAITACVHPTGRTGGGERMAEFLHIEEVPLDEITDIYINELQIKFNTMLESFKKAIIPADQMEFTVKRELSFVIDLCKKIDIELGDLEKIDNTLLPEVNGSISYFEYLAIQSTSDDLGPFIPDTIKNKDAYWKRVKLAYRKSLFEGYSLFVQGMINTVFDISRSPEYWRMRTIAEMDKTRETPPEPAPDTQTADYLTDEEYLKRLVDTGFIMINSYIKDKIVYMVKRGHTVLDVFDELAKITGSELRARAVMLQNMTGVESTLNTHRPKHSLKT